MNKLSIIITFYNKEDHILDCLESLKKQRNKNFDLIIVDDGSTDASASIVKDAIKDSTQNINYITLETNQGHAYARNRALDEVETPYVMFLDADDQLASYAVEFYLSKVNGLDGLVAPVHKFSLKDRPQYIDKDQIRVKYLTQKSNPNSFLRKNTVCNILFKTAIIQGHHIRFNEDLNIYTDTSFIVDYIKYAEKFVRVLNFPFYFRGEVYDPFEGNALSSQDFIYTFEDYVNSYFDAISRTDNKKVKDFLTDKMKSKNQKWFRSIIKRH